MLEIICDHREPSTIIDGLRELGMMVIEQQLDVADYVVSEAIGIERKSGSDFVTSLADQRLFDQIQRLIEAYSQPIIILENLETAFELEGWQDRKKHTYGALCYIAVQARIPVLPTSSIEETIILLNRIASWAQEEKKDPILARKMPKSRSDFEQQQFLLEGLPDIGSKLAQTLLDTFETPMGVFAAIAQSQVLFTRTGNLKGINGSLNQIKGVGPKKLQKLKQILLEKSEERPKKRNSSVSQTKRLDSLIK